VQKIITSIGFAERSAPRTVRAVQEVRALRGETRSHLMRCDDGYLYVVKFKDNPRGSRVLANELMGTLLARSLGLPCSTPMIVEIDHHIADDVQGRTPRVHGDSALCQPGLHFGSRYLSPFRGLLYDYLPIKALNRVSNIRTLAGMLTIDKWLGNTDKRQIVLGHFCNDSTYQVVSIDYGRCFNAAAWNFPDRCEHGSYVNNAVYHQVTDWCSFEPWLSRIENMHLDVIRAVADQIPHVWYASDRRALTSLVASLATRKTAVRALIASFGALPSEPFPNWEDHSLFLTQKSTYRRMI
jgi:hypothetical protein